MGVQGLWQLLEPSSKSITLDALEGRRLAVDISLWLHQAEQGYSRHNNNTSKHPHLSLLMRRISKLLFYKIRPVFVFDGDEIPPFKRQIIRERGLKRHLDELVLSRTKINRLESLLKQNQNSSPEASNGSPSNSDLSNNSHCLDGIPSSSKPIIEPRNDLLLKTPGTILDKQIDFLRSLKEEAKNEKLRPVEIPNDSETFSNFQLKRLLQRSEINTQLENLTSEKLRRKVGCMNKQKKVFGIVDSGLNTHFLIKNSEKEVCISRRSEDGDGNSSSDSIVFNDQITETFLENNDEQNDILLQRALLDSAKQTSLDLNDRSNSSESNIDDDDFIEVIDVASELIQSDLVKSSFICSDESSDESDQTKSDFEFLESSSEDDDAFSNNKIDDAQPKLKKLDDHSNFISSANPWQDEGIYADCRKLLSFLGLPFIQAPGEAEAQCVELEQLNLVNGIITDDSDVWLFGGRTIYKNMFSHRKHVQEYRLIDIKNQTGLSRKDFIQIAMLSGGDYAKGLNKIGIVAALEIISEFTITEQKSNSLLIDSFDQSLNLLKSVRNWLLDPKSTTRPGTSVKSRIMSTILKNNDKNTILELANVDVFNAYAEPKVNSSSQIFKWERIKFDLLYKFLGEKLGLNEHLLNKGNYNAFQKWDAFLNSSTIGRYQTKITSFQSSLNVGDDFSNAPTRRTKQALNKLKSKRTSHTNEKQFPKTFLHTSKTRGRKLNKNSSNSFKNPNKRKNLCQTIGPSNNDGFCSNNLNLSESSYSD